MDDHKELLGTIRIDEKKGKLRALFTSTDGTHSEGLTDITVSDYSKIGSEKKKCIIKRSKQGGTILAIEVEINGEFQILYTKAKNDEKPPAYSARSVLKAEARTGQRELKTEKKSVSSNNYADKYTSEQNQYNLSDTVTKSTYFLKTRLPLDTRLALSEINSELENYSLKLNKTARFDFVNTKLFEDNANVVVNIPDNYKNRITFRCNPKIKRDETRYYCILSIEGCISELEKNIFKDFSTNKHYKINVDEIFEKQWEKKKFEFFKSNQFEIKPCFNTLDFKRISKHHKQSIDKLPLSFAKKPIERKVDWRLIVGLGNESVYETSMTLHHIYGFPYIPASAIKGVVRSWIITEIFGNCKSDSPEENYPLINAEHRAYLNTAFCTIFGCPKETKAVEFDEINKIPKFKNIENNSYKYLHPELTALKEEHQGKVWFFDAYPTELPTIKADIMNPHYGKYYSDKTGKTPPADHLSPVPIPFLTVESTSFQFIIGIKPIDNKTLDKISDLSAFISSANGKLTNTFTLLQVVQYWLEQTLINHGIGAKTAVGYGYMK